MYSGFERGARSRLRARAVLEIPSSGRARLSIVPHVDAIVGFFFYLKKKSIFLNK